MKGYIVVARNIKKRHFQAAHGLVKPTPLLIHYFFIPRVPFNKISHTEYKFRLKQIDFCDRIQ